MKYLQIDIEIRKKEIEPVLGLLLVNGITDTIIEDPADLDRLLNKEVEYEWDYISPEVLARKDSCPKITFYLEDTRDNRKKAEDIAEAVVGAFPEACIKTSLDDDEEWKGKWKEFFKPARVGERIVVKPTWEEYAPEEKDLVIEIDPGMAFGTGTHETTSMCIKLMEKYVKPGDMVLDVGCGSGILSVAASLLGAGNTLAVDIDPEAVKVASENVVLNGCSDRVAVMEGNLVEGIDFKAHVVAANLMADLVMMLSNHVASHLLPGGIYISSGILTEKEKIVSEAIVKCGFRIIEVIHDGMWCAIAATL
ncbi:MAG: 50S ribosomal protein L11 methyltransferase [Firmicutes bacterium]|nr:50S ribosomal protein L11 methyltransferase [Bacillota bacterium]